MLVALSCAMVLVLLAAQTLSTITSLPTAEDVFLGKSHFLAKCFIHQL